ncbi:hypothetical protein NKH18_32420 [Streptomyces sp. M10(2022)]
MDRHTHGTTDPLILIALAVWFWLRARRKTAAYMAAYESDDGAGGRRDRETPQEPTP